MHIVINGWFVGQSTAGSGQYVEHLLAELPRQAPQTRFSLLLPRATSEPIDQSQSHWPGIEVVTHTLPPMPENLAKLWWEQVTVPQLARRMAADLLWVPYWAAPYWQPIPVAVTVHDLIPYLLPAYRGGLLQRVYTALVAHTARRSAAVITVSHASARDVIQHLHIPGERVHVVYHGPNQAPTDDMDVEWLTAIRQKYNLPERYFLYLGGFDARKNVAATLHAYRRYLDRGGDTAVKLIIAGRLPQTDSAFAPDPQKIAAELNLLQQVQFSGFVPDADKPALYALSTAYIFPSLYEGFGMMLLEAMGAGTPVVTSAHPTEQAL